MKNILYILLLFSFGCYAQGIPRKLAIKEVSGISSSQNNYNLDLVDIVKLSSTQEISITGIVAQIGAKATLHNTGSFTITLKYEDSNSTDVNRFVFASGADYVLPPGRKLTIYYDATDQRWLDYEDRSLGSVSLPAPSIQSSSISFSAITFGQATISCTSGNGGFRLFVVSANPIASFPINNVQYGENTIFPNGSDLGGGVYVVSSGTDVSVVVTGLSAATLYYAMAMEYDISGAAISYNTNVGSNSSSFTTLSNATTPTQQFVIDELLPEQTKIRIKGTRGNGDDILGLISLTAQPNTNPVDGNDYNVNDALGNATVKYEGADHDFHISGLPRDRMVWLKIMERETTGNLYNTQATIDSLWTKFIYDSLFSSGTPEFENWIVHQTAGFTYSVSNDSLKYSGNPAGFRDYFYHKDIIPDTLRDFKQQAIITIDKSLSSGDSGTGIGLFNDVDTEANRGVVGLLVTNPASANFGRVQIYSGTGATDPTAFSFRDQSSGAFVPAKDSSYLLTLEPKIQGNDIVYTFSAMDLYDSIIHSASWTELNRPSDAFYGTTMKPIIYVNGGPFRLKPFSLGRTNFEAAEPPTPPIFDADLVVSKQGDDVNDCSPSTPCLTVNRLTQRIGELSPTVQDCFIGAGTYTESSFLSWPENTGEVRGAGRNLTRIQGAASLYTSTTVTNPNRSGDSRALMTLSSGSQTDVTTKFVSMNFYGNKDVGGTTNSMRHCFVINRRDGVVLEDVAITFFNTTGLKLGNVDDFRMENWYMESNAGEASNFAFYQIQTYNIGGGTVEVDTTNYRIIFKDGLMVGEKSLFNGDAWSDGAGWGMTGGSGLTKYVTNTLWENVEFRINKIGISQFSGHRFNMEGLYMSTGNLLIRNCKFNNNISFGGLGDLTHALGWTRVTRNFFDLAPNNPTFVIEMQNSFVEIDSNFVRGAKSGVFISLNCQNTHGSTEYRPMMSGDHGNWDVHHNIIELSTNDGGYGMIGGTNWDTKTVHFRNNTIRYTTTSGSSWRVVVRAASSGVSCTVSGANLTGLIVQNNLFLGQFPSSSTFWGLVQGTITGGISRYNYSTHLVTSQTQSGVTVSNSPAPAGSGNPFTLGLGAVPTTWAEAFTGDYYRPQSGSSLINNGFGSVTIGALKEN